jgi:hypothetical protein
MAAVSNIAETVTGLVNSLESHEGTMTDRERHLCTTLLHGLAAAGQLRPATQGAGVPDYNFETATEQERWCFDQGYESGWNSRLDPSIMDMDDIREELLVCITALERIKTERS